MDLYILNRDELLMVYPCLPFGVMIVNLWALPGGKIVR